MFEHMYICEFSNHIYKHVYNRLTFLFAKLYKDAYINYNAR